MWDYITITTHSTMVGSVRGSPHLVQWEWPDLYGMEWPQSRLGHCSTKGVIGMPARTPPYIGM